MLNKNFYTKLIFLLTMLFVFPLCKNSYSQQHWSKIATPTTKQLTRVSFIDTLNGWAVGDSGVILKTTNGGYNWTLQNSGINNYMQSVFFLNSRLGWALAWNFGPDYGTYILRTTNGGIKWDTAKYSEFDIYIRTIMFRDSLTGFMGGGPKLFLKTTDGGASWYKCGVDTNVFISGFPINNIRYFSNGYGVACGGIMDIAGLIWTTTNAGEYWDVKIIASEPINDVKFFDSLNILAVAGDFEYGTSILKTSDGGANWSYKNLGILAMPYALAFKNNSEGWAPLGYLPRFMRTTDSGQNWDIVNTPDSTQIFDLKFINNRFAIGVGYNGAVIKYNPDVTYTISGTVRYSETNQLITSGKVKAFRLNKNNGQIVYVDSANILNDGTYSLTHVPQDSLDIGVFPNSTPPNDYVITYYPSTIYWQNATVLYPYANLASVDIYAKKLVTSSASNSISGKVMQNVYSPSFGLKDAVVYAMSGNDFVKVTTTDSIGVYHLVSLPVGNLKVIINRLGFSSDSTIVNVTLTSNIDSVNFYLHQVFVGIKQVSEILPHEFKLYQNYPNPFNPVTNIKFQIKESGIVTLKIFDVLGREIVVLVNQKLNAGEYVVPFSIYQNSNYTIPSGIYFYRLQSGNYVETKRMVLIK